MFKQLGNPKDKFAFSLYMLNFTTATIPGNTKGGI